MPDPPPATIFLRPIGSPLTVGLSGLAIASLVQSGLDLGWIAKTEASQVGLVMLAVPFILQLIACVFSYLARDGAAGASVGVLSTTWLAIGLLHITSPGATSGALGLLLLAAGGTLALSALATGIAKPLAAAVFLCAALRFGLSGIYELSSNGSWENVSGIVGLVVCGLAAYALVAFELEGQKRHPVLPTFRRSRGEAAVTAGWNGQLDGVEHEAGVRQTS
jgi:succinate-acetate transporter protein